jgi:hypothetical protein
VASFDQFRLTCLNLYFSFTSSVCLSAVELTSVVLTLSSGIGSGAVDDIFMASHWLFGLRVYPDWQDTQEVVF